MEKLKQATETEESLSTAMADDIISQLPIHILHNILCSLSQQEAVRTCLLSKQWRHIGSTRPNLKFSDKWFNNKQEKFVSVVDRALQRYRDQNLSLNKLHLYISSSNSRRVVSPLDKWIPVIAALNIKAFKLNFHSAYYDLPSTVFLVESLERLHMWGYRVSSVESVRFKCLRKLTLIYVKVDDSTLETITSGCPLLRSLVIESCWELRNVMLSEAALPEFKHFDLESYQWREKCSIVIHALNVETICIKGPWIWSNCQSTFLFSSHECESQ
ncbi:Unknown protein [Striga hermonthica]|uniref:F-box domain-containing protein n=1 Tax=Striga hermonthica TaxID=68872 RepID=A0A9N7NP01_STRHE|nr:Unknown protein [Striga hermonthica]